MAKFSNMHGTVSLFQKLIKSNARRPVLFVKGEWCEPYEYRCKNCNELRISCVTSNVCANCGSANIIKGELGTL